MIRQQLIGMKCFFRMEHGEGEERGLGNGHTILETCEPKKGQLHALKMADFRRFTALNGR